MQNLKQKPFRDKFKNYLLLIFFILIFLYFIFKIQNFLIGPKVEIYSPLPYSIIKDDTFILQGNAKNAKNIYINGREININENGDFAEKLITKAPYTLIIIEAIDNYGKTISKTMSISKE